MVYNILHFDWWNWMSAWKSCRGSNCREVSLSCHKDEDELVAEGKFFPVLYELNAKFFRTKASYQSILLSQQDLSLTAPKCLDCLSIMFYSITRYQLSHHSRFCNKELNFKIYDTAS